MSITGREVRWGGTAKDEMDMEEGFNAYVETALWSSMDDEGVPLEENYGIEDLAPETLETMREEFQDFYASVRGKTDGILTPSALGHNFWLTQNRHGAGFWDLGLEDGLGKWLTDLAMAYGGVDLYVGDDGRIYC